MVRKGLSDGEEGLSHGEENSTSWTGRAELCLAHVADTVQGVMERLLTDIHTYFFSSWMIKFPYCPGIRCGKVTALSTGMGIEVMCTISRPGPYKPPVKWCLRLFLYWLTG